MKKVQDLKVNDLFKKNNVILKVLKITSSRIVYQNTENLGKVVMGFKQFNYWNPNGVEIV